MAEPQQRHCIGWQPSVAFSPKSLARSGWPRAGNGGAMLTGAWFLMLVLLALLLAAFIYQIATTPLTAVDAPTVARAAAASVAAPELPARRSRVSAATGPAHRTAAAGASRRLPSWSASALTIAGLGAVAL